MPPNVIVCRHCKKPVSVAELTSDANKHQQKLFGFGWKDSRHALAVLEEGGPPTAIAAAPSSVDACWCVSSA